MGGRLAIGFWLAFAAALAVYLAMVLWSLPKIAVAADGQAPFDMRPMGYGLEEARSFLSALTAEGRQFYLTTQHRLDTLYPPLLAVSLTLGLWITWPARSILAKALLSIIPLLAMVADLAENVFVSDLLMMPPEAIDSEPVMLASAATAFKSALTTIAMTMLLITTALWGWRKWRRS